MSLHPPKSNHSTSGAGTSRPLIHDAQNGAQIMRRFPSFARHVGTRSSPRGSVRAWAVESATGAISIRLTLPAGGERVTVVEMPVSAARDAVMVLGEAIADARNALELISGTGKSHPGGAQAWGNDG